MNNNNILSVDNKVIIIFGGCGILGTEWAKHLLSQNAYICVADLDISKFKNNFKDVVKKYEKRLMFSKIDVTKKKSLEKCITTVLFKFKKIDVVINASAMNAPFDKKSNRAQFSSIFDYPENLWKKALEINLTGAFLISQVASRYFLKINKGHLINIGSNYGLVAPDQSIYKEKGKQKFFKPADYIVSKFGIIGLNKYLAAYFKNTKVRFNVLTPSGVKHKQSKTFINKYSKNTMLNRMSNKNEYSGAIQFLCSDASSYMTGSNLVIDGGWTVV
jgi:NAD(P)-dependent dehydrogenase (short-subunit alcohol dehydrogenase family)